MNTTLSAITASTGGVGMRTRSSVDKASVIECATVNPRDRNQQAARRAGNEHQAGDEQQVIDADPDVLHAEQCVLGCNRKTVLCVGHRPLKLARFEDAQVFLAVAEPDLVQRRQRRIDGRELDTYYTTRQPLLAPK